MKEKKMVGSFFERTINAMPTPACKAFLHNGKLSPIGFASAGRKPVHELAAHALPHIHASPLLIPKRRITTQPKRVAVLFSGGPAAGGAQRACWIKKDAWQKHTFWRARRTGRAFAGTAL